MPRAKALDLTPNFSAMFQRSLDNAKGEVRRMVRGDFGDIANPMTDHDRIEITRRVQNLLALLNIAAHAIASPEDVQTFRETLEAITADMQTAADRLEDGEDAPTTNTRSKRTPRNAENGTGKEA